MYRVSRYNHFQPWDQNTHLAYNAATGAVALMTGDNLAMYQRIAAKLESGDEVSFDAAEQELLAQLVHGKFVLPDSYSEIEQYKFTHRRHRFDESTMGLVIAPTMACNMACQYCFEANKKGRMSAAVVEDVIGFVESRATQLRLMDVSWYGGEPLLAMDIIEDLTESFLDLADQYNFKYAASMISNGYLLTKETADRLRDLHVTSIQITLDGPSRIHDVKRPLKNGRSSFATIVENIGYACDVLDISVRVNVDRTTTDDVVSELLQELDSAGLRRKVAINFGKIEPATSACADIAESCYENADFAEVETRFYGMLLDHGFWVGKLPQPASTVCIAQQINSFLIDHEGYIYKCFNYVGDTDRAMGRIADDIDFSHPNFTDLFRFDPFDDSSCRDCSLLPICLGGCPARRAEGVEHTEQLCDSWKYNLRPMLEIVARARQRQMQSATQEAL